MQNGWAWLLDIAEILGPPRVATGQESRPDIKRYDLQSVKGFQEGKGAKIKRATIAMALVAAGRSSAGRGWL